MNKKSYEVRSNLKNFTETAYEPRYCVQFEVRSASRSCQKKPELASLRRGSSVCVLCMSLAEAPGARCKGDGAGHSLSSFKMMMETRCFGTWERVTEEEECHCPRINSFIFM